MTRQSDLELNVFIEGWQETPEKIKTIFLSLREHLLRQEGVSLEFVSRPGISHSLRASHARQRKRRLFAMIDVVDDDPRWLSVCFYGDAVADPEERGDAVPGGLLGEDAVCFDIVAWDDDLISYLETRLDEACRHAAAE